jgi:Tfp pilus assembly protein PilW
MRRLCDQGLTLAEMLVAMTLAMILGAMATTFFTIALHAGDHTLLMNQGTGNARVTLDSWTSMLRTAGWLDVNTEVDRFEEITPTKIVFYSNVNNRTNPTSGAVIAGTNVNPVTKVALILRQPSPGSDGQLIEVQFRADNATTRLVRQLVPNANQANGAWLFTPYDRSGGAVDPSLNGCVSGTTPTVGLCLQAPAGAGMLDPTVSSATLNVTSGSLRGNGSADSILANVGRIDISFAVRNTTGTYSAVYASSASVNSGYSS